MGLSASVGQCSLVAASGMTIFNIDCIYYENYTEAITTFYLMSHSSNITHALSPFYQLGRPPQGPMCFAPVAASSRIDKDLSKLSKTISNQQFF